MENVLNLLSLWLYLIWIFINQQKKFYQKLKPHLHKGSIIVFDEFNCPHFPGETIAAMEELDFKKAEFLQSPYLPYNTIYKFS